MAQTTLATPGEARLREALGLALATRDAAEITAALKEFETEAARLRHSRPSELRARDRAADPDWPQDAVEYSFYVDAFGSPNAHGTFATTTALLPYLQQLGVSLLYPLPFLPSPGRDGGFDVSDYFSVAPRLGREADFDRFSREAHQRGMRLKMDLVLNHVSDQHPWFKALEAGDRSARSYFLTLPHPPEIARVETQGGLPLVVYKEKRPDGTVREVPRRLIFPDFSPDHYREVTVIGGPDRGKRLWVYHTFTPFQLDLDYRNPMVLREAYRALGFWANRGVDLFRLDAIPFLDKERENSPRTHAVVELLARFLEEVAPSARLQVEACEPPKELVRYFGEPERSRRRPTEAQIAYDFPLMNAFWLALATERKAPLLDHFTSFPTVPPHAVLARFLRLHDELTLEMMAPGAASQVRAALVGPGRGVPFRGQGGIAGRLANFLGNDRHRIRLADSLLFSTSGLVVLYYGDEIAAANNPAFASRKAAARAADFARLGLKTSGLDARDVGRGPIAPERFLTAAAGKKKDLAAETFHVVQTMLRIRKEHPALRRGTRATVSTDSPAVLAYWKKKGGDAVLVLANLSHAKIETRLEGVHGAYRDLLGSPSGDRACGGEALCHITLAPYEVQWLTPLARE